MMKKNQDKPKEIQMCKRCIFDENVPSISFDDEGICNYCRQTEELEKEYPTGKKGDAIMKKLVKEIKEAGRGKPYDCVVGVSGGCDSSYLIYRAKKYGLRPLAVHFDNTWNSVTASENIRFVLQKLNVDLYTYVMDNEEFNDMARSFLKASVPEIDALSDIALTTVLYMAADKYNIKYMFNGHNFRTEGMMPLGWFYFDGKYIADIHQKFGTIKMKSYPNLWLLKWLRYLLFTKVKRIRPIYYMEYDKNDVKKFLHKEFGWNWYGGHHMENKYTVFCDNYIMPVKFGIDMRYVEFSALIRSGQMTKKQALEEIKTLPPTEPELIEEVKKRLGFTDKEFAQIMKLPLKSAKDYKTYHKTFRLMRPFFLIMLKANLIPKSFYLKYCLT